MSEPEYSIGAYGEMLADKLRVEAYAQALRQVVRPGGVVLEIGAGIGAFSVVACQLGAAKVYAIEPNDAIEIARKIAFVNGCADRIEFIQDLSTNITLPQKADVIVSDLRGILPWYKGNILTLIDARERLLATGGVLIPSEDRLMAAVVEDPAGYDRGYGIWRHRPMNVDIESGRSASINYWARATKELTSDRFLSRPEQAARLDYRTAISPDLYSRLDVAVARAGVAHGIYLWFETDLLPDCGFSFSSRRPQSTYGQMFLPWIEPVEVEPGDSVELNIEARLVNEEYIWRWRTRVLTASDRREKANFDQSTFYQGAVTPKAFRQRSSAHIANLSEDGRIDRFILDHMDGSTPSAAIAEALYREFPKRFANSAQAMGRVGKLSVKYSR